MNSLDLTVLVIYLVGLLAMGAIFARQKSTKEMFAAGGRSPWWLSGISAFMTTFSAGTFVVWGGIAYQYGMVGVSILVVTGIAAILAGWFFAGRWKNFGYDSAAEFLVARYGRSIVQFYTWLHGTIGLFTIGGAIYALAVIVTALIPLSEGHILADPATGHFSVTIASLIICVVVILITTGGGLWAVLMTDVLQFIILTVSVLFVVPLILFHVGGPAEFVASAPENFFLPVAAEYTWWFLAGWSLVFFFKFGGEWAYIQRFACVPSGRDAEKSSYLFGFLYLVSPLIWMLPPMVYRLIDPNANYEQAYILACQVVLPAGMLGLMIAAMCSATASMATTQLNVFAGAFTTEFYQQLLRPDAKEKELVIVGRVITLLLGGIATAGALLIPYLGTYTGYILASIAILTGPLVLPTIWGLYSRKISLRAAWMVTIFGIIVGLGVKIGIQPNGWLSDMDMFGAIAQVLLAHERVTDIVVGTAFPLLLLIGVELFTKETNSGWTQIIANRNKHKEDILVSPSTFAAHLCGWSTYSIALMISVIAIIQTEGRLITAIFAGVLFIIGSGILAGANRVKRINQNEV